MKQGIREALASDPRVFLMGEDVGKYGGCFAVSKGLLDEFGEERIRDTPLSESAFVGAGIGAALGGMRPIVEIMTVNFSLLALDQIVNNAATLCHMSGGQFQRAARDPHGDGRRAATRGAAFAQPRGLVRAHARAARRRAGDDRRRARHAAAGARDPDPVLIFEHVALYNMEGELDRGAGPLDLRARACAGRDATSRWSPTARASGAALAAADELAGDGIEAEVVDLRTLRPLDDATILASVRRRTARRDRGRRLAQRRLSAEIGARIVEQAFYDLDAPIARVCSAEVPIPVPEAPRGRRAAAARHESSPRCRG